MLIEMLLAFSTDPGLGSLQKPTADLKSPQIEVRLHALCELSDMGSAAAPAIPVIVEVMNHDFDDRRDAVFALGSIGRPAVPALVAEWKRELTGWRNRPNGDPRDQCDSFALQRLAAMGKEAAPAVGDLVAELGQVGDAERMQSIREMRWVCGMAIGILGERNTYSFDVLAAIGPTTIPELLKTLSKGDQNAASGAAYALYLMRDEARPALPGLIAFLSSPLEFLASRQGTATIVVTTIQKMGPFAKTATPRLLALLENPPAFPEDVRPNRKRGTTKAELWDAIPGNREKFRLFVAAALAEIGGQDDAVIQKLLSGWKSDTIPMPFNGYRPEPSMSPRWLLAAARGFPPQKDEWDLARRIAPLVRSSGDAGSKEIIPLLIDWIERDHDTDVALKLLGCSRPQAMSAVPLLKRMMSSRPKDAHLYASTILAINPTEPDALGFVHRRLREGGGDPRKDMLYALLHAEVKSPALLPDFLLLIEPFSDMTDSEPLKLIGALGEAASPAIPQFENALKSGLDVPDTHWRLLESIARIGPRGKSLAPAALPLVRAALKEDGRLNQLLVQETAKAFPTDRDLMELLWRRRESKNPDVRCIAWKTLEEMATMRHRANKCK